jgi:hypothetical protein
MNMLLRQAAEVRITGQQADRAARKYGQLAVLLFGQIKPESLPVMSPAERADLEREVGHPFSTNEEAHTYRVYKLNVVTNMESLMERLKITKLEEEK